MKKILGVFLLFAFVLSSCSAGKLGLDFSKPTETPTPTETQVNTATATVTTTPTITLTPTPSVAYKIVGLDFGPYTRAGQNPNEGTVISEDQLREQIELISPYTQWIRTYGCSGFEQVIPIAHSYGIKVAFGAWIGKDEAANEKEIACLVKAANLYEPDQVLVGSEVLYRGDLSAAKLIGYMDTVKMMLPDIAVSTADTAASWLSHKELITASDVVFANIYPYWEGRAVEDALMWLDATYTKLETMAGEKEVWVSETGWPDAGNTMKGAVPSSENAANYFLNFISWAKAKSVNYFYFEAFDEPWKETEENPQEGHWGLWTSSYELKTGMEKVFEGDSVEDNWTATATPVPSPIPTKAEMPPEQEATPEGPQDTGSISIYLPAGVTWPQNGIVAGYVKNVDPAQYKVAIYINVGGGWWSKPYFDHPSVNIYENGYWEAPFVTGGNDSEASEIVVVLMPKTKSVDLAEGGGLPGLGDYATARISR
ncbi:MAG: glycosyl hydrolase family 17 protein [Anaerolineaceae bacterium]|nr:glycosyl hydrolase family 17 protein [Anaerolineaceae bacterium]